MNLQQAFETGRVAGVAGLPDRTIETLISKLYFFGDDVYKVYKYEKAFIGDFSDKSFRDEFYHDDFTWNSTMAPEIYLKLGYVKGEGDAFVETTRDDTEDYYILMRKIDDTQTLFNHVRKGDVSVSDVELVTTEMFSRLEQLSSIKRPEMKDMFDMPYVDLDLQNLESTRNWLYMAPDLIPKTETDEIIDRVKAFVASHPYFRDFDTKNYLSAIDNHGGNILFTDGQVNFIDSMPPMRIWRVQSDAYLISRPATDLEVLMGKGHADAMFAKYEEVRNTKLDPQVKAYLQVVAALIQAPYMYVLGEREYAQKFWDFAKIKVTEI